MRGGVKMILGGAKLISRVEYGIIERMKEDEMMLIDKGAGRSSFFYVAKVRRELTQKREEEERERLLAEGKIKKELGGKKKRIKVGHTGTLDPFATGLLILLVGKGTKRSGEFLKLDKEYRTTVRLGAISTTGDPEGEIRERKVEKEPTRKEVEEAVKEFVGEIEQKVPRFSAVKIQGQRAYKLARERKEVEMPTRKVKIYELEVEEYKYPELKIRCKVSSGTYVRQLGEDIGERLGTGAYLTALRRTKVGEYCVEDASVV